MPRAFGPGDPAQVSRPRGESVTVGLPAARPRRLSVERKIQVGFAVALALVGVVGVTALRSTAGTVASAGWVSHTLEVESTLQQTLQNLIDAETGARGFALTGRDRFLQPYDSALAHTAGLVTRLRTLTADNPLQQPRVAELDSLASVRVKLLAGLIAARRQRGLEAAAREAATGAGKAVMDRIRGVIVAMNSEERQLLGRRAAALLAAARLARGMVWLGMALAVALAFVSAVFIGRDLAGRRRAEQALMESERRLFQILEAIPIGVFVVDAAAHPHYANRASQDLLGKGIVPAATGEQLPEVYQVYVAGTTESYPPQRLPIVRALQGEHVSIADIEIHRPDRIVPLEVWASPVRDHAGRVVFAVAAFSDITERRRAQADIDRLNAELSGRVAQLQVLNRELEAFSYSVSHDLRAPLRSIDGFSKVLLEDYAPQLDATAQDSLRRIRAATQRMGEQIDGMLTLARVSRAELKHEVVDLSALARAIADQLRRAEPERQVDVVVADGLVTEGDGRLLRAVLENLVGNAWKFSRHRPRARIEVGVQSGGDGERAYYVRDDGAGFDMAYVGKLFGVFQRLHGMTEFEGTGIGLATVQRIIHRHGGRVWAEGALERGATFYFTLSSDKGPHAEADAAARRG